MPLSHLISVLLVVLVWGFNFVPIRLGLNEISPLLLCALRFLLTSIPAVFFVKFPRASFRMVALYGLVMFALQFSLLFMGISAGVAPGLASILQQNQVLFSILLGLIFLDEKLSHWQIAGMLLSFSGIALIGMEIGSNATFSGFLLVIGASLSWGIGNFTAKKIGKVDMFALVIWSSLIAWPPLLALSLWIEGPSRLLESMQNLSWKGVGSVLYVSYLATLFGMAVWNWVLHHHRLSVVAPFTLLVPIIAMTSSALILGEQIQTWKVTAALLVISGVYVNLAGPRLFKKRNS
ncbi:MAG TPA: EamA family transporter [Rhabdochlamydiaceae bacterium]|jgi:O-acetylserine/cysteine efflux transporter